MRRRHHCVHYQSMYSTEWGGDIIVFTISLCTPQSEEETSLCSISVYVLHRVRRRHHCVHYRVQRRHHCVHYQSMYSIEWGGDIIVFTIKWGGDIIVFTICLCTPQSEEGTSLCSLLVYVLHRVRRRHHCVHYQSMYSIEWGGDIIVFTLEWGGDIIVFTISLCNPQSEEETSLCSLSIYVLHRVRGRHLCVHYRVRRRHHCVHYQSMYSTEWGGDIIEFIINLCTPQSEEETSFCSLSVYVLHRVRGRHLCVHYGVRRRHHCLHYQSMYSTEWGGDIVVFTISLCTP